MERIRWSEKLLPFRTVVDNPTVTKPALVQIGNRLVVVGETLNGEFLLASPCHRKGDRSEASDKTILVTSKHPGIWKVVSKTTSKRDGLIHRLTTKDLESIHKQDLHNGRTSPRTYVCLKEIDAFELIIHANDPYIANGQRVERLPRRIPENVEFHISDIGEAEYTPTAGEITSQDYVKPPNARSTKILNALVPGVAGPDRLIRNRVLRTIYCRTKGEKNNRHFLLEVNEQACDIRPIASDGSSELRYLHSTKNLFDYLLNFGNDTTLEVKLVRGDSPSKAAESNGRMVFRIALNGDRIPLCQIQDFEIILASPDLPVRVRLPSATESGWRSLADIRHAELQCMQLSVALLSRHESDIFLHVESDRIGSNFLQQSYHEEKQEQPLSNSVTEKEKRSNHSSSKVKFVHQGRSLDSRPSLRATTSIHHGSPRTSRAAPLTHPVSDRLYQEEERRVAQATRPAERTTRTDLPEKLTSAPRSILREKPSTAAKSYTGTIPK